MQFTLKTRSLFLTLMLGVSFASHAYEPEVGSPAKAIENFEFVDGSPLDLASMKGKPIVIYVGADWCEPCVLRGRPTALKVNQKYAPLGLQTIFISLDDNKLRALKIEESKTTGLRIAMAKLSVCPLKSCFSGLRELGAFGRAYQYPSAFVIDAEGVVKAKMDRGQGVQNGLESAVAKVMQAYAGANR
jgi:thiol-disulfide isomerase/thioredoxin